MFHWAKWSRFQARLGMVAFVVSVYCIWLKRNQRIFHNTVRPESVVIKDIDSYIQDKAWHWQVDKTFVNWLLCKEWGINERVLL